MTKTQYRMRIKRNYKKRQAVEKRLNKLKDKIAMHMRAIEKLGDSKDPLSLRLSELIAESNEIEHEADRYLE